MSARGITADSRKIVAGHVFAAWPGYKTDGRRFLGAAVERGAAAVLWESGDGFRAGEDFARAVLAPGVAEEMANLFKNCKDPIEIIKWKEILQSVEDVTDDCEDLVVTFRRVVLKYA